MAKYDWKQLERDYVLSNSKSITEFLKEKKIPNNGSTRKYTMGWNTIKRQNEDKTNTKIIEKVIEKKAEKEAKKIITVYSVAEKLLKKIEEITAKEEINVWSIKKITSSLKDINDIVNGNKNIATENNYIDEFEKAWRIRNEK